MPEDGDAHRELELVIEYLPWSIIDPLDRLAQLPANWDSYGAVPIDSKTITRAKAVLRQILKIAPRGLPLPFIAPAGDGTIVLEWQTETGKELILDVPPGNSPLSFLLVESSGIDGKGETEGVIGEDWTLDEVIRRLSAR